MQNLSVVAVLDSIKERHGLKSDYAVCKLLGCSTQLVANWRHGRALPDEKSCGLLAAAAGIDPLVLAAQVQAQRSKTAEARSLWEAIAARLQVAAHGLAAVIFSVVFATGFIATDARAASAGTDQASENQPVNLLYIVSTWTALLFLALGWAAMRFDRGFLPLFVPQP